MDRFTKDTLRRRVIKAARKTKGDTITIKAQSTKQMQQYLDWGFEVVTALSLGTGAGFQSYLMKISRKDLDLAA